MPLNRFKPSSKCIFTDIPRQCFFCGSVLLVVLRVGVCCTVVSFPCSLVVTCWERADLLAVVLGCVLSLSKMCSGPHQN